jgi:hypothetical protein
VLVPDTRTAILAIVEAAEGRNRQIRTTPPPLSEWDPLVILCSPSGSLGVQPARSEPRSTVSGGGAVMMRERRLFLGKEYRLSDLSELKRFSVVTQVLDPQ